MYDLVLYCIKCRSSFFISLCISIFLNILFAPESTIKEKVAVGQRSDKTVTQSSPVVGFQGNAETWFNLFVIESGVGRHQWSYATEPNVCLV